MKKAVVGITLGLLFCGAVFSWAKYESGSRDAASSVMYGNSGSGITPVAVDASGKIQLNMTSMTSDITTTGNVTAGGGISAVRLTENVYNASGSIINGNTTYRFSGSELFKSVDNMQTWSVIKGFSNATQARCLYSTDNGYVYLSPYTTSSTSLLNSTDMGLWVSDDGTNFTRNLNLSNNATIWGITENSLGHIYVGTYTITGKYAEIFKSVDNGTSFSSVYANNTTFNHVHDVAVDILTDDIYAALGDIGSGGILKSTDNGTTWIPILTSLPQMTSILTTPTSRLFGTDSSGLGRIYRSTDDTTATIVLDDEFYQNCFLLIRNNNTGNIYAGFKLDPTATMPLKCRLYVSEDDGLTWVVVKELNYLNAGDGFEFSSEFNNSKALIGVRQQGRWENSLLLEDGIYSKLVVDSNDINNDGITRTSGGNYLLVNGNLGVGTTNPVDKLFVTVNTVGNISISSATSNTVGINLIRGGLSTDAYVDRGLYNSGGNLLFQRFASNVTTEDMRILATGLVGIGTSAPSAKLAIKTADSTPASGLFIGGAAGGVITFIGDNTNACWSLYINQTGTATTKQVTCPSAL